MEQSSQQSKINIYNQQIVLRVNKYFWKDYKRIL